MLRRIAVFAAALTAASRSCPSGRGGDLERDRHLLRTDRIAGRCEPVGAPGGGGEAGRLAADDRRGDDRDGGTAGPDSVCADLRPGSSRSHEALHGPRDDFGGREDPLPDRRGLPGSDARRPGPGYGRPGAAGSKSPSSRHTHISPGTDSAGAVAYGSAGVFSSISPVIGTNRTGMMSCSVMRPSGPLAKTLSSWKNPPTGITMRPPGAS